ncbi:hypothetical protein K474DRAFT_1669091 [Panus rudis PR-1116 ss-1]|nr:hypothetical protein K474DRAFT_1669091 [Panus rudis PR-1116 ss-1]
MGYVASRKFCCCLPVRFGVFCMTILGLGIGGLVCTFGWIEVNKYMKKEVELEQFQQIALWFVSIEWSFTALINLMGLIGCLCASRSLVSSYAYSVTLNIFINIGTGIYFIYALFHKNKDAIEEKCHANDDGEAAKITHWFCQTGFGLVRVLIVIAFVIIWIFMLAGIFIVFDYVGQLHEEFDAKMEDREKSYRPTPAPVVVNVPHESAPMNTTYAPSPALQGGWTSAKSPYAFNLPNNAYGNA